MWEAMKRPNIRITEIEEGNEAQIKDSDNIFNKILKENFPNLKGETPTKVQETCKTPNDLNQKMKCPQHIIIKILNVRNKENMRSCKGKGPINI